MSIETIFDEYMKHDIDSLTAIERLQEHCFMSYKEAESIVEAWDCDKADQKYQSQVA